MPGVASLRNVPAAVAMIRHQPPARRRALRLMLATSVLALAPVLLLASGRVSIVPIVCAVAAVVPLFSLAWLIAERADGPAPSSAPAEAAAPPPDELAAAEIERRREAMNRMAAAIEHDLVAALEPLKADAARMKAISDSIAAGAERMGENAVVSSEAADRSVEAAATLSQDAEQLNLAIHSISEQAGQATGIAANAVSATEEARTVIATLSGQAGSIQAVVDLIRTVAAQTNLLALNATIEAARAGDAGRGFGVVANEVKLLARKTAQSTESIAATVNAILSSNKQAAAAMDRIGEAVAAMNCIAAATSAAVNAQRQATAHIAQSISNTMAAAQGISERIMNVTMEVGQSFENTADLHLAADTIATDTIAFAEAFRHIVTRAVRQSAPEVDRRGSQRKPVDLECNVKIEPHGDFVGQLLDVSETGARLTVPVDLVVPAGAPGLLTIATSAPVLHGRSLAFATVSAYPANGETTVRLRFTSQTIDAETVNFLSGESDSGVAQPTAAAA